MVARFGMVMLFLTAMALAAESTTAAMLRPAKERQDITEVGDPVLVGRNVLGREMRVNGSLRDYIELYGWPDYAEIQEITVSDPWAAYEVRVYYLRRNQYLVFGRVHVAPSVDDYGVRKYDGKIDPETLDRLLTASPPVEEISARPADVDAYVVVAAAPPAEVVAAVETAPDVETTEILAADAAEVAAAEPEEVVIAAAEEPEGVVVAAAAPAVVAEPEGERSSKYPDLSSIVNRLEAAADRAALAAEEAERASLAAMAAADRATGALDKVMAEYED